MKIEGNATTYPTLPPDVYEVEIDEVKDEFTGEYGTSLPVKLKVLSGEFEGEDTVDFIRLNDKYLNEGFIGSRSRLFKLLAALGTDMDEAVSVNTDDWLGKRLRVRIDYPDMPDGKKGDTPKPVDYMSFDRARRDPGRNGDSRRGNLRERLEPRDGDRNDD